MDNLFDSKSIERLGKTLVRIAGVAPTWVVTETPLMTWCFRAMSKVADLPGKVQTEQRLNANVAAKLGFHSSQYELPGITWAKVSGYMVPLVQATHAEFSQYLEERRPVQVLPQMLAQVDHIFRRRSLPKTVLPENDLAWWLRSSLRNSPVHWYVQERPTEKTGPNTLPTLDVDFSTICDSVAHESSDCKYNVRDISLSAAGQLTINARSELQSVEHRTSSEQNDRSAFRHSVFLTLTLVQQANQVSYHNWIHFHFNDLVAFNIQNQLPAGHWVRTLTDPHMRYQKVLNNAGMFSRVPNDPRPNEVYDDILFGANLSSWTLDTFNANIIDKVLGYYQKADHSRACAETNGLEFNLQELVSAPKGEMQAFVQRLDQRIQAFVREVVDRCATEADTKLLSLINENVLSFLHKGCLDGIEDKSPRGIFTKIVSRYILQAGIVHGLEHYSMYFWFAPLHLPQRIRRVFDTSLTLEDYSYPIDKQNGHFGNEMFCRYAPNPDNQWNWQTLRYGFADKTLDASAQTFVADVQRAIADYDRDVLGPARDVLTKNGIAIPEACHLTPNRIGCSICM